MVILRLLLALVVSLPAFGAITGYTASCPATAPLNVPVVASITLTPVPNYFTGSGEILHIVPGANASVLFPNGSYTANYQQSIGSFGINFFVTGTALGNITITFMNDQGWTDPSPCTINIVAQARLAVYGAPAALVQTANASGHTATFTVTMSPASTGTVIFGVALFANPVYPFAGPTVVDNLGNSCIQDTGINYDYTGTNQYVAILRCPPHSGVTSFTVSRVDGRNDVSWTAIAAEFSGIATSSPVDTVDTFGQDWHSGTPGCSTCWVTGVISTSKNTDLLIGMGWTVDSCTKPPGAGTLPYLLVATVLDCSIPNGTSSSMVYALVNQAGGYVPGGSLYYAVAVAAAYKTVDNIVTTGYIVP